MKRLLFLVVLSGCGGWRAHDTLAQSAVLYSMALDYGQTLDITRNCMEANPIMGPCGERVDPTLYFTAVMAGNTAISALLPPPWRYLFQGGVLLVQSHTLIHNHRHSK